MTSETGHGHQMPARGETPPESLRIGLMLDSFTVPAWLARAIDEALDLPFTKVVSVLLNAEKALSEPAPSPTTRDRLRHPLATAARVRSRSRTLLWEHFLAHDYRTHRDDVGRFDAFAEVDIEDRFTHVTVRRAKPAHPRPFEDRFDDIVLSALAGDRLDVLLRFGFNIIRGGILDVARYGVWSHHHGDNRMYRGGPALFWEMYEGNPVSGTVLQVLTEELDAGNVIYRSWSRTAQLSLYGNRNETYWKSSDYIVRCLRELHEGGWSSLEERARSELPVDRTRPIFRTPTNAQMLKFDASLVARRRLRRAREHYLREQWFLAHRRPRSSEADPEGWQVLEPPADRFWADPFVLRHGERDVILFEDYSYDAGKGVISALEIADGKVVTPPEVVLERPYHLSYPSLFHHDGRIFMLPETEANHTVELYEAVDFPRRWELRHVLLEGLNAVDPTMLSYDGRLWLFANVAMPGASTHDELHVFWSTSLQGPWTPHARNPVVTDVRSARPAGAIILNGAQLVRPAQDSSRRYGHSVTFNRIERLSPTEFRETAMVRLDPGWLRGNLATHTYNRSKTIEVIDGCRLVPRPAPRGNAWRGAVARALARAPTSTGF